MRLAVIFTLFLIFLMQGSLSADVIILDDGEPIKGKIIEETDSYIRIDYEGAETIFFRDQIINITRDSTPLSHTDKRGMPQIDKPSSSWPPEAAPPVVETIDSSGDDQGQTLTITPITTEAPEQKPVSTPPSIVPRQSGPISDDLLIEQVLELSGQKSLVEYIPKYFLFFLQEEPFVSLGEYREKLSLIIREDLSPDFTYGIFSGYVAEHYQRGEFLAILEWLASPLSKKISALKSDISAISAGTEPQRLYADLESTYVGRRRLDLFREYDDIFGRADIDIKTQIATVKALGEILNYALPVRNRIKRSKLDEYNADIAFESKELVKKNISESAYTYRSLSNDELREYIDFFASDTGGRFIALTHLAYFNTIRELTLILKQKVLE